MGMFSEAAAEATAKQLESIILDLIKGSDWSDIRSAARGVAKKKLYRWYLSECSEAFIAANPIIKKEFGELPDLPDLSNDSSPMNTFGHDV